MLQTITTVSAQAYHFYHCFYSEDRNQLQSHKKPVSAQNPFNTLFNK